MDLFIKQNVINYYKKCVGWKFGSLMSASCVRSQYKLQSKLELNNVYNIFLMIVSFIDIVNVISIM